MDEEMEEVNRLVEETMSRIESIQQRIGINPESEDIHEHRRHEFLLYKEIIRLEDEVDALRGGTAQDML